ncbi:MAG: hypothetical protein ACOH2F_00785 [Cellulomonas sp.]
MPDTLDEKTFTDTFTGRAVVTSSARLRVRAPTRSWQLNLEPGTGTTTPLWSGPTSCPR